MKKNIDYDLVIYFMFVLLMIIAISAYDYFNKQQEIELKKIEIQNKSFDKTTRDNIEKIKNNQ